jgi:hypothetical protein
VRLDSQKMIVANFGAFVGTEGNGDGEAVVWNCSCFCHLCDGGDVVYGDCAFRLHSHMESPACQFEVAAQ